MGHVLCMCCKVNFYIFFSVVVRHECSSVLHIMFACCVLAFLQQGIHCIFCLHQGVFQSPCWLLFFEQIVSCHEFWGLSLCRSVASPGHRFLQKNPQCFRGHWVQVRLGLPILLGEGEGYLGSAFNGSGTACFWGVLMVLEEQLAAPLA